MRLMNTPRSIDVAITNKCNLRCLYCSHFSSPTDVNEDLSKEEWLKFFNELNRCAVMSVCLQGGEPLCRNDIEDIITAIADNRMRYSILTNGTKITDKLADFIASTKRCEFIQVSIDGSNPGTHDIFRGKGTFEKAVNGIKILKAHNVPASVRVTIHKNNVNDLEAIARLLLEDLGLDSFSTNAASYVGLCRANSEKVRLSIDDYGRAMETMLKLSKKYGDRITSQAGPHFDALNWIEMSKPIDTKVNGLRGTLSACNCIFEKIAVRPDGAIIPCIQLGHIELGRINKDSLKEIWQHHPELNRLRERQKISLRQFDECKECQYVDRCTGGCPALAYTIFESVYRPSPDSCLKRYIESGGKLPDKGLQKNRS